MKHCLKLDIGVSITKNVVPTFESSQKFLHYFVIFMHNHILVLQLILCFHFEFDYI